MAIPDGNPGKCPEIPQCTPAAQSGARAEAQQETAHPEVNRPSSPTPSQIDNIVVVPNVNTAYPLTAEEIMSGKKILFCYRRFVFRRKEMAVQTIWLYYSRYRLRYKIPHTATDELIRNLHKEYQKDVESIGHISPYTKSLNYHKKILLGCMPHVVTYLRGLDQAKQKQKEANMKQLKDAHHEQLEQIESNLNACSAWFKRVKNLMPRIIPGSPALLDIKTLREQVIQVDTLQGEIVRVFGQDVIPQSLEEHYWLGIMVILAPPSRAAAPKTQKPELNFSDLGDIF